MKILVTGATGRSEADSPDALPSAAITCAPSCAIRRAPRACAKIGSSSPRAICSKWTLAAAVRGVDAVVHCAAFFRGATPEQAHAVNDLGTQHLANAARAASVKRFIFTSTGLVYGPRGGRPAREDDACAPMDRYPASKLAAERFLLAMEGLDVRVLRLPFVYGDGDPHIAEAIPMMSGFPPAQRMSLGHHADVAQAVVRLLDAPSPAHRIYNVVDDEAPDLATLFASVGRRRPTARTPSERALSMRSSTAAASAKTSASSPGSPASPTRSPQAHSPTRRRRPSCLEADPARRQARRSNSEPARERVVERRRRRVCPRDGAIGTNEHRRAVFGARVMHASRE